MTTPLLGVNGSTLTLTTISLIACLSFTAGSEGEWGGEEEGRGKGGEGEREGGGGGGGEREGGGERRGEERGGEERKEGRKREEKVASRRRVKLRGAEKEME